MNVNSDPDVTPELNFFCNLVVIAKRNCYEDKIKRTLFQLINETNQKSIIKFQVEALTQFGITLQYVLDTAFGPLGPYDVSMGLSLYVHTGNSESSALGMCLHALGGYSNLPSSHPSRRHVTFKPDKPKKHHMSLRPKRI